MTNNNPQTEKSILDMTPEERHAYIGSLMSPGVLAREGIRSMLIADGEDGNEADRIYEGDDCDWKRLDKACQMT